LGPIPNPQSPIPNPHLTRLKKSKNNIIIKNNKSKIKNKINLLILFKPRTNKCHQI